MGLVDQCRMGEESVITVGAGGGEAAVMGWRVRKNVPGVPERRQVAR